MISDKEPETYGEIQQRIGELHVEIQRLTQKILGNQMQGVYQHQPYGRPICEACRKGGVCGCYQPGWDSPVA